MIIKKIKKIIVPLDGSENARRGLEMALSIAKVSDATVLGVHAIYEPPQSEFQGSQSIDSKVSNVIKKYMDEYKDLASKNGIEFSYKIVTGSIGHNILKIAHDKKEKFDLIVIGSRGRGSVKEMFFGSVSNYVLHASKIPVLIVK